MSVDWPRERSCRTLSRAGNATAPGVSSTSKHHTPPYFKRLTLLSSTRDTYDYNGAPTRIPTPGARASGLPTWHGDHA